MFKRLTLSLLIVASLFCAAPIHAQDAEEKIVLPPQNTSEYWVVRSRAISELITFLTMKRTELNEDLSHFTSFLDKLGKADDFITSNVEVPKDPKYRFQMLGILEDVEESASVKVPEKPMTWEQMVEIAMKFVVEEGYSSVDFEDGEELRQYKAVLKNRENFLKKIRSDVNNQVEACLKAWFYLDTINQQTGFKLYRFQTVESERKSKEEKAAASRAEQGAEARQRRRDLKDEETRRRQERLNRSYSNSYWGW
jgi:hypothetical protein